MMTIINFLVGCAALALFIYIGIFVISFIIVLFEFIIALIIAGVRVFFRID